MTTLPYEEQNIPLHLGAHALADRTGATRDDAWEQMSRYLHEGKLTFHGNADGVYLSAAGHRLAEANRDMGRLAALPANDYRIVQAFAEWTVLPVRFPTRGNANNVDWPCPGQQPRRSRPWLRPR
jgi:hypothetical protein